MADKRRYSDRRNYLIKAVQRRRKRIREKAIACKGGRCEICGYARCSEALEFHHIDDAKKISVYLRKAIRAAGRR